MIETRESQAAAAPSAPEARRVHDSELDALLAAAAEPEIGLLNFTVSFALALWVALRARGLGGRRWRDLLRAVWRAFYLRPARFVLPGQ